MPATVERRVPFLDLRIHDADERAALMRAVERVFEHGRIVLGPEVDELERRVAARVGRRHAVGVASGTDACYLALRGLGIGPGDEVVTTSLSWIATANAVALTGATPVFADIGDDLNIDPAGAERCITPRTRAIMPVHYTGKMCDMDAIMAIAARHGLHVVEDASQAFDAEFGGRKSGSFGVLGCFSMNPMKVLAACGEAGMIVTDRDDLRERLIALRYNGTVNREECVTPSHNGRLDTLQAAILLERLDRVGGIVTRRRQIAGWYAELLGGVVGTPVERRGDVDIYYTYQIRAPRRDELKAQLESRGVETKIQHPYLMCQQPAYQPQPADACPNATRLQREILCLPVHEKLERADVEYVADCVRAFYAG
jgi:dTDP-4-amino-4,6-dideoxygalactose transaminase